MKKDKKALSRITFTIISLFLFAFTVNAETGQVTVSGTEYYDVAKEIVDQVNAERAKENLPALTYDVKLSEVSMKRAAETSILWSHIRPDGSNWYTITSTTILGSTWGENILADNSASPSASRAVNAWLGSSSHKASMMSESYKTIGVGVIRVGNANYYVQNFGTADNGTNTKTGTNSFTTKVNTTDTNLDLTSSLTNEYGKTIKLDLDSFETTTIFKDNKPIDKNTLASSKGDWYTYTNLSTSDFNFYSDNKDVVTINAKGEIESVGLGTTKVHFDLGNIKYSYDVEVTGTEPELLNTFEITNATLSFEDGDTPTFTGKTNSEIYDIVEYWTEYSFFNNYDEVAASDRTSIEKYYQVNGITGTALTKFEAGKRYSYTVGIHIKDKYKNRYYLSNYYLYDATITINGKKYTVSPDVLFNPEGDEIEYILTDIVTIDISTPEKPIEIIDRVEINNATLDFNVGDAPKFTGTTNSDKYTFDEAWTEYYHFEYGTGGITNSATSNKDENEMLKEYDAYLDKFESGKRYDYRLNIYLKENDSVTYLFPAAGETLTVVVNGKEYKVTKWNDTTSWSFENEIYLEMPFIVNNVTKEFNADDEPLFTGSYNTDDYQIVEYWTEYTSDEGHTLDDNFFNRTGTSSSKDKTFENTLTNFEGKKKYSYSLEFNMACSPYSYYNCAEFYLEKGKTVKILVDGKLYTAEIVNEENDTWGVKDLFVIEIPEKVIPIESITLDKEKATIKIGEDLTLTSTIYPSDATGNKKVTWTSSDDSIAIVDQSGVVTGIGAGTATITATTSNGKRATATITVLKLDLEIEDYEDINDVYGFTKSFEYENGANQEVIFTSSDETVAKITHTLEKGTDLNVSNTNTINAVGVGNARITVKYLESEIYNSLTKTFNVIFGKKELTITNAEVDDKDYDGLKDATAKNVEISGLVNNDVITLNEDYSVNAKFKDENAGENKDVTVEVSLIDTDVTKNYILKENTVSSKANINAIEIKEDEVKLEEGGFIYNGNAFEPKVTVTLNKEELVKNKDFEVTYKDNTNAGTASVTVKGIGNYKGEIVKEFTIQKANISVEIQEIEDVIYNGNEQTPEVVVTDSVKELASEEYEVSYSNNVNAGTAKVTVTSNNINYTFATIESEFTIKKATITEENVTLSRDKVTYSGNEKIVDITIKVDNRTLTNKDYEAVYADNIEIGTATITITGKGNYEGEVLVHFEIVAKQSSELSFVESSINKTYEDEPFQEKVNVKVGDGTITYTSSDDSIASVDNDGNVTIHKVGNVTISSTISETEDYLSATASYELTISKSESGNPSSSIKEFRVSEGTTLSTIELPENMTWEDDTTTVSKGSNACNAIYYKNNDSDNYLPTIVKVPVYGLTTINISTKVIGGNGTASANKETAEEDELVEVTLTPNEGYEVEEVLVNGTITKVNNNKLNITATNKEIEITVTFKLQTFEVTIEGTENVNIDGYSETVDYDTTKEYTITPKKGYRITSIKVNGESVELVDEVLTVSNIKEDTTIEITTEKIVYEFFEITNYIKGETEIAEFRIDAEYSLFESVYIDNQLVDPSNYTSESGSTIIVMLKSFMDTLSVGTHGIRVTYSDGGEANATFKVSKPAATPEEPIPHTGMNHNLEVLYISIIGLFALIVYKKQYN